MPGIWFGKKMLLWTSRAGMIAGCSKKMLAIAELTAELQQTPGSTLRLPSCFVTSPFFALHV
jgi:hypothetical protein